MSLRGFFARFRLGRDTADDWQPGDLAVCRSSNQWCDLNTGRSKDGPKAEDMLRVKTIAMRWGRLFLRFESWPSDWFAAYCFRKITPRQDEACTAGFKLRMKGLRPKVDA